MGRFWLLAWLVFLLALSGIVARQGALIALALPLVLYVAVSLLYTPGELRLDVSRTLSPDTVQQGKPARVTLTVTNTGPSVEMLEIRQPLPPRLHSSSNLERLCAALQPGEQIEISGALTGSRGVYQLPPLFVVACDHLGIFPLRRDLAAQARLMILPEVTRLKRVSIRPLQTRPYPGPILSRKGGPGTDFFGLREYQTSDPLRRVNWRASARHAEELFTNEFEREHIADVGIILDARQQTDVPGPAGPLFEYSVHAAASLADAFLRDGNRVSLLIYGYGLDQTFPGYGKVQRQRILRSLAQANTGMNYSLSSLTYLPTRLFPARSQIIMVSPLDLRDGQALVRLRASGYDLLVVSPNPVEFQAQALSNEPGVQEALRLARLERTLLLRSLRRAGIPVLDWTVTQPFERFIHPALKAQSAMRTLRMSL